MKASEYIKFRIKVLSEEIQHCSDKDANIAINASIITYNHVLQKIEKQEKQTRSVFRWLLGYTNFPIRGASGPYYWRTHLRAKIKKLGIEFK